MECPYVPTHVPTEREGIYGLILLVHGYRSARRQQVCLGGGVRAAAVTTRRSCAGSAGRSECAPAAPATDRIARTVHVKTGRTGTRAHTRAHRHALTHARTHARPHAHTHARARALNYWVIFGDRASTRETGGRIGGVTGGCNGQTSPAGVAMPWPWPVNTVPRN